MLIYLDKNIGSLEMDYRLEFKKVNRLDDEIRVNIFNSYEQRFSISEQVYAINECSRVIIEGEFQLYLILQTFGYDDWGNDNTYIKIFNNFYERFHGKISFRSIFKNTIFTMINPCLKTLNINYGCFYKKLNIKLDNSYIIVQEGGIKYETEFIQIELDKYRDRLQLLYDEYCNWIKNNIKDELILHYTLEWISDLDLINKFIDTKRSTFMRYQLN